MFASVVSLALDSFLRFFCKGSSLSAGALACRLHFIVVAVSSDGASTDTSLVGGTFRGRPWGFFARGGGSTSTGREMFEAGPSALVFFLQA